MIPPGARFDDLVDGTTRHFAAPVRTIVATATCDVVAALREVDAATRAGAWAYGFVGYEAAPGLDPALQAHEPSDGDAPLVWFAVGDGPGADGPPVASGGYELGTWHLEPGAAQYERDVETVRTRIAAGRTYQVNLTARLHAEFAGDPNAYYATMLQRQRTRYGALIDTGAYVVISASPELFFEWSGEHLLTRPMKGTATRGRTVAEDDAQVAALTASAKERAENVIVVDLLRNDLGRIARTGSVQAARIGAVERYDTVFQLTSDVTARVDPDTALADVFAALFPSGSVTGAPKPSTMSIIRDLEPHPRGVYCGAIGWVAPPGGATRARFSVAIRTAVLDRSRGRLVYGTGGGVTWSSTPQAEVAELLLKSQVVADTPADDFDLLETMRYESGTIRNLAAHLDRLGSSSCYWGFSFDRDHVVSALERAVADVDSARVRLTLGRAGAAHVVLAPLPAVPGGPVTLAVDTEPIDSRQPWPFHKTTRRAPYSTRAARHDTDDVVLLNERGNVTETTIANIAALLDGEWCTPPAEDGCLPGVERARLLAAGELRERSITPADLYRASGLAVLSSLRGRREAVLVDPAPAGYP